MTGALRQFTARQQADGFVPSDIDGLSLWLDADDPDTITANASDEVSQWDDKSGDDRHATSSDAGVTTGAATLNGRNVISHAGTTTAYMSASWPTGTAAGTWFVVWDAAAQTSFMAVSTSDTGRFMGAASDGSTAGTSDMGSPSLFVDGVSFTGNRGDLHTLMSGTATVFAGVGAINNRATGSGNLYRTSYSAGAFPTQGGLAEVICYSGSLSTTDRETVESYLADKWGITL